MLLNLVTNAIRHGDVGGRVEVRARPSLEKAVVLVSVDDDGPGIPGELLPRVFSRFTRAGPAQVRQPDRVTSRTTRASASGWVSSHGLMSAMGGDLTVRLSSPTGTSMLLRIPRA